SLSLPRARLVGAGRPFPPRPRPVGRAEELGQGDESGVGYSANSEREMPSRLSPFAIRALPILTAKPEIAMPTPFAVLGIDHVVLRAADPAALERFYLDVLGCTFEKRQGKLAQL